MQKDIPKKSALHAAITEAMGAFPGRVVNLSGLNASSKAFFTASLFQRSKRPALVLMPDEETSDGMAEDLRFFLGASNVNHYRSTETLPFESAVVHQEISAGRIELLFKLCSGEPFVTVASMQSVMQRVIPKSDLIGSRIILKTGGDCPMERLIDDLAAAGYSRMAIVEERGEMSVRGGILDIFPPMEAAPLRIEFFADIVESIRAFDIGTQRSLKDLKEALILPARETLFKGRRSNVRERLIERAEELGLPRSSWEPLSSRIRDGAVAGMDSLLPLFYDNPGSIFDYISANTTVITIDPDSAASEMRRLAKEIAEARERLIPKKQFFVEPAGLYLTPDEIDARIKKLTVVNIEDLKTAATQVMTEANRDITAEIRIKDKKGRLLAPLAAKVRIWLEDGMRVYLSAHNKGQAERTRELLEGYGFNASVIEGRNIIGRSGTEFCIATGSISGGFKVLSEALVIIAEEEVFGERVKRRPPPSKKLDAFLTALQDLSVGDFIVHRHHGIGIYRGLKRLNIDAVESEFLLLEYRGEDKLYLPVWRMNLISKYHGVEGSAPELDKLGGTGWEKKKTRVKHAVEMLAGELLKLYAEREKAEGYAFSPPDAVFREFEAGFEFDETDDQARAIEECIKDMTKARPMDRLVCGDVGYGKTEVAIRAAFKAVLDRKQAAVLVPTTVLAQQHYGTFSKRLAPFAVNVEVLSRFKSAKEQRATLTRLAAGGVDIIIGTHRLLQKDVVVKDLGLLVIDEEHRFGVKHKERLKQLRKRVDVLTLTATPIPRTLHMSLAGIRELSIINTPPEDRLAVKTTVIRYDEDIIKDAIEREMNRGGQVFFVHNRVQSIGVMEEMLARILPGARVAVAHGQMKEDELERKMLGFVSHEYDVLLCTAIIESGLDIPSANTIIINRADRFGLAELYQLRGRVGRSSHRAYAYFICPPTIELTDDARKRMEVIQELGEPGSGFRVATYDLEIRGAGDLLGSAQSGRIAEVGFEMYTELLEEAVSELKGGAIEEEADPEINLRVSQYIPEDYIPETRQRLNFYKRLSSVACEEDIDAIREELTDRFGPVPTLMDNLVRTMELRLLLKGLKAREMTQKGMRLFITFTERSGIVEDTLVSTVMGLIKKYPKKYRLTPESALCVLLSAEADPIEEARYVLKELLKGCYS